MLSTRQKALEREMLRTAISSFYSSGGRKTNLPPEPDPPRLLVGEKYGIYENALTGCFSDILPRGFSLLDQ